MTEVTDADRQAAARIYQRFRDHDYAKWIMDGTNASGNGDSVIQAFARHREAAEAPLRAALIKARDTFQHYGDLHAAKPDPVKAQRNYELAAEMAAALGASHDADA